MTEWLDELFSQLRQLPPARQLLLAITASGSLAFFGWLVFGAAADETRALYRNLPEEEVARVADALAAERIEYEIADGGTSILVSASEVAEARIRLAGRGLPSGGNTGFELFDAPAFGVTNFVHRVNYARAVQGELARSIEQLEPVERARVQVVMPERGSVLERHERQASASAVVKLLPGRELSNGQVQAIVHLIASGLEGLDPARVTVVDGSGKLLAPLDDGGPGATSTAGGTGYQERLEAELSTRIESILEKTVGPGNVAARVRAELDWSEVEKTEEVYDPDSQVARSERRSTEETRDESVGGVPGVAANQPDISPGADRAAAGSSQETETINYEISKSVSHTRVPSGRVKRLSIAVLVADPVPAAAEGAEGEQAPTPAEPWSAEHLTLFEALARDASGFDEGRGDRITVRSAPFQLPGSDVAFDEPSAWPQWSPLLSIALRGLLVVAALLLFARMVVQPLASSLPAAAAVDPSRLPARLSDMEAGLGLEAGGGSAVALDGGSASNEDGARALRNWLNQS